MKIIRKKNILCSTVNPSQGIFWWINDSVVPFTEEVNYNDFDTFENFGNQTHISSWRHISDLHKVNGKVVAYNYFPRGRVIITPIFDDDYNFYGYECYVYCDKCIINNNSFRSKLERTFNIDIPTCSVYYEGETASDNTHYTCHNCSTQ